MHFRLGSTGVMEHKRAGSHRQFNDIYENDKGKGFKRIMKSQTGTERSWALGPFITSSKMPLLLGRGLRS